MNVVIVLLICTVGAVTKGVMQYYKVTHPTAYYAIGFLTAATAMAVHTI